MRYAIAGGGTAGHIYPALAIAQAIQELDPAAEFLYIGTKTGREADLVPRAGLPFAPIASAGLVNLSLWDKLVGGLKVVRGLVDSLSHLRRFRPDVVIGTGGYVSGPVMLAARLLGRPVVIQEQNAFPGVTNRIAARWARLVFVPFQEARPHFPGGARLAVIGNPVRQEVLKATREGGRRTFGYGPDEKVIVVMGGSGGAPNFHRGVVAAIRRLKEEMPAVKVLHVTGERYLRQVQEAYGSTPGVTIVPYLHNMPEAMAAADAGVFRAGALTLVEIAASRLPSVLIPSPNVTHNHQEWNARMLEQRGAALVVRERDLTPEALAGALRTLLTDADRAAAMRQALAGAVQPDAARRIAEKIVAIAREGR
jgi:UDP-N-acetylglucosamine--N-acetylmuramyl-(pentapeptide) pyrophosphoryl-undecaprenol N-acetylglucosamine transferase